MGEISQDSGGQPIINRVPGFDRSPAEVATGMIEQGGEHALGEGSVPEVELVAPGKAEVNPRSADVGADIGMPDDKDKYGHLFDPNTTDSAFGVDKAAVRLDSGSQPTKPPAQTSDRPSYWGGPATQEQIDNAAAHGFDLKAANDKYNPGWDKE